MYFKYKKVKRRQKIKLQATKPEGTRTGKQTNVSERYAEVHIGKIKSP